MVILCEHCKRNFLIYDIMLHTWGYFRIKGVSKSNSFFFITGTTMKQYSLDGIIRTHLQLLYFLKMQQLYQICIHYRPTVTNRSWWWLFWSAHLSTRNGNETPNSFYIGLRTAADVNDFGVFCLWQQAGILTMQLTATT